MSKELWLNLPVKDVKRSKEFYTAIGFAPNIHHQDENSASFYVGDNKVVMMLFPEETFKQFSRNYVADTSLGTEVLFSIGADSREEVDKIAKIAGESGGKVFGEPSEVMGWMYGCGFSDPDGHHWNALFMDKSKMPR